MSTISSTGTHRPKSSNSNYRFAGNMSRPLRDCNASFLSGNVLRNTGHTSLTAEQSRLSPSFKLQVSSPGELHRPWQFLGRIEGGTTYKQFQRLALLLGDYFRIAWAKKPSCGRADSVGDCAHRSREFLAGQKSR